MRAQFFDGFNFSTFKYSIVAIEYPEAFFQIEHFSLCPAIYNEACLRGYTGIFTINKQKRLTLKTLLTNHSDMTPPVIDTIEPTIFHSPAGNLRYDLNHELTYSGSILIGNHFIESYFIPFGFQLPHAFKNVFELTFKNGLFVQVENKSKDAARLRLEYQKPLPSTQRLKLRVGEFIGKSEEYGFSDDLLAQYMDLSYETKYLF